MRGCYGCEKGSASSIKVKETDCQNVLGKCVRSQNKRVPKISIKRENGGYKKESRRNWGQIKRGEAEWKFNTPMISMEKEEKRAREKKLMVMWTKARREGGHTGKKDK